MPAQPQDVEALQPASSGNRLLLGLQVGDEDVVGSGRAALSTGRVGGRLGGARFVSGARALLAVGYLSGRPVLLLGTGPNGVGCCSAVSTLAPGRGLRVGQPFLSGLAGSVQARLVPDGRRLLAVIAADAGAWAALSSADGRRFTTPRRLTAGGLSPQSVAATVGGDGGVTVAITVRSGGLTAAGPSEILAARAAAGRLPGPGRAVVRMAPGHAADELALSSAPAPQLTWVESDVDSSGRFRSVVRSGPLGPSSVQARTLSAGGDTASGLTAAGTGTGPFVVAWRSCDAGGACRAQVVLGAPRNSRGRAAPSAPVFSGVRSLGRLDSDQIPIAAVSADGVPAVGWIGGGRVQVARGAHGRLATPAVLARTAFATGLVLGAAGARGLLAAWVEGTARERVVASQLA